MNVSRIKSISAAGALLLLILLLCFPSQSAQGVLKGLSCCAQRVIPALFPFFVVSNLIMSGPAADWLGILVRPFARYGMGIREKSACSALVLSWLGGFAVAAGTISRLYEQGQISKRQAELLLVCGVGSSPAFVINTVGLLMLNRFRLGVCLCIALFLSNLCCGVFAAKLFSQKNFSGQVPPNDTQKVVLGGLVPAVGQAVQSSLTVCGFVVFFSCLSACLEPIFSSAFPQIPGIPAVLNSLLEVTSGCLSAASLPQNQAPFACCITLSLLSLSVLLQVRSLLCKEISLKFLLWFRPMHLGLSLCFFRMLLRFFPGCMEASSTLVGQVIPQARLAPDAAMVLFLLCCLVLSALAPHNKRTDPAC